MDEPIWIGIIIIALYIWAETYSCIKANRQAQKKAAASEPIDGTNWLIYDCEGRIKQYGDELMKLTGGERRKGK